MVQVAVRGNLARIGVVLSASLGFWLRDYDLSGSPVGGALCNQNLGALGRLCGV